MQLIDKDALLDRLDVARNTAEFACNYGIEAGIATAVKIVKAAKGLGNGNAYWKDYYKCSACGFIPNCYVDGFNYCPRCGASMKGTTK